MGQYCSQVIDEVQRRGGGASSANATEASQNRPKRVPLLSWQRDAGAPPTHRPGVSSSSTTFTASRNPADYTAAGLQGMRWHRLPGQVDDQRINIDNCAQCQVFLLDQCDSVQIDDCRECVFFIGPTSGSVFVRNCTDCVFVIACGQLRTRDVKRCTLSLHCTSRPVIESSSDLKLCCFSARHQYFMLENHMKRAKLSAFNNLYWFVHDFTPSARGPNYSFVPQTEFESSYDVAIMQLQAQGGGFTTTFRAVPVLSAGVPEYISGEEDMLVYTSIVAIPFTSGFYGRGDQVASEARLRTLLVYASEGLSEAQSLMQNIELQRREYYALQGQGPLEQIVQLVGTMEKVFTAEDVNQILSVTSSSGFWNFEEGNMAKPQGGPRSVGTAVAHVADRDPKTVQHALQALVGDACVCFLVATAVENPPLLAVHRTMAAHAFRTRRQPLLQLDLTRPDTCEAIHQLSDLIFCKLPLSGSGFGATLR